MPRPVNDHDASGDPTDRTSRAGRGPVAELASMPDAHPDNPNPVLASLAQAVPVQIAAIRRQAPVFNNAVVVYLGSNPHKSVALRGNVVVDSIQAVGPDGRVVEIVNKKIPDEGGEGITSYDFSLRDSVGRFITTRMVPLGHPTLGQYANKTFQPCEHPDHLLYFFRAGGGGEYAVVCPPDALEELRDYFRYRAGQFRDQDAEFESVQTHATASAL